jgi:predicted nucleotidyltransferase
MIAAQVDGIKTTYLAAAGIRGPACGTRFRCAIVLLGTRPVMAIVPLLRQKRRDILRIAGKNGAHSVRIFGSVARGEADASSDVDFLVELETGRSLLDLGGLQFELEAMLDRPVDVVTERGLKRRVRERVLREAVAV